MREIKFRVWDSINGKWLLGYEYESLRGFSMFGEVMMAGEWSGVLNSFKIEDWYKIKLMQFTGLKDKNGVDIYEGDLLEFKNDLGKHLLHKIFYKEGGLCFNIHQDDFYNPSDEINFYEACADMQSKGWIVQCEIIGNIYENPELLK